MNFKTAFQDNERAVSPVIGVILMVAITVILAAVIGTFVLGLGDQIGQNANAGVSVDNPNSTHVTVTLIDKGNVENVSVRGNNTINITDVGGTATVEYRDDDTVQVVGILPDGTETVVRTIEK